MTEFLVTRTSDPCCSPVPQPCDDSYPIKVMISEGNERHPEPLYAARWVVTLNTLEEFTAFIIKEGRCVVGEGITDGRIEIEIYDDWRE
jgi:hypothetical protein